MVFPWFKAGDLPHQLGRPRRCTERPGPQGYHAAELASQAKGRPWEFNSSLTKPQATYMDYVINAISIYETCVYLCVYIYMIISYVYIYI